MGDASEMLRRQQEELERIRAKRNKPMLRLEKKTIRLILNIIYFLLALVGLGLYFFLPGHKDTGFYIIICALCVKVVELIIRNLG